jgi:hypothetical protein
MSGQNRRKKLAKLIWQNWERFSEDGQPPFSLEDFDKVAKAGGIRSAEVWLSYILPEYADSMLNSMLAGLYEDDFEDFERKIYFFLGMQRDYVQRALGEVQARDPITRLLS